MQILKPPNSIHSRGEDGPTLFLAGSIEMGKAEDWQSQIQNALKNESCVIYNPRRDDWDSSWEQDISNPEFRGQVEWELDAQEVVDLILTKAPITLLELGLAAASNSSILVVCCPKGFWRKGNVDVVCERYQIDQVDTLEELIEFAKNYCRASQSFDDY